MIDRAMSPLGAIRRQDGEERNQPEYMSKSQWEREGERGREREREGERADIGRECTE